MKQSPLPTEPLASRFGWPGANRLEEFRRLLAKPPGATHRIVFKGRPTDLPIIRVPINLPKYRLSNGRTASAQQEYLAKHPEAGPDFFERDPELLEAQEAQHQLLLTLVRQADLLDYFKKDANEQVDPILLDEQGFVVNGNRRLSCWRELLHTEPKDFSHFQHVDVAVLPHCDEQEIDRIEATLQIKRDIRADYSWDTQANMMLQKQKQHGFKSKEIADLYGMRPGEVDELIDMLRYAGEYLKSRGKENQWSLVAGDEFAFRELVRSRQKVHSVGDQELFKEAAFTLIERPDTTGGRLYAAIPKIQEYLGPLKDKLSEVLPRTEQVREDPEAEALFGGANQYKFKDPAIPLVAELKKPENSAKVREAIAEVIASQDELKREKKNANYLLGLLAKANAALQAAISDGLRPESNATGVKAQIAQIEDKLARILRWVEEREARHDAKHRV